MKSAQRNSETETTSKSLENLSLIFQKMKNFRPNQCTQRLFHQPKAKHLVVEMKTEYNDQKIYGMGNWKKSDLMLILEQIVHLLAQSA
jgi:hypothetical protein